MQEPNLPEKPNICCGYPTDTGESISSLLDEEEEGMSNPRAGDIAICLNCGTWLVYMNGENVMRLAQLRDLAVLDLENLRRLKKLRKYIRRRGRFWPKKRAGERFSPN
jgi:hypothetical protein